MLCRDWEGLMWLMEKGCCILPIIGISASQPRKGNGPKTMAGWLRYDIHHVYIKSGLAATMTNCEYCTMELATERVAFVVCVLTLSKFALRPHTTCVILFRKPVHKAVKYSKLLGVPASAEASSCRCLHYTMHHFKRLYCSMRIVCPLSTQKCFSAFQLTESMDPISGQTTGWAAIHRSRVS